MIILPHRRNIFRLFNPFEFDSSVGLWVAGRKESIYSNLNPVSTIKDNSGNNYNFSSSGASRPLFIENAIENFPAYDFDGSDDWANAGDVLDMGLDSFTLMMVLKKDSLSADGVGLICKSYAGGSTGRWWSSCDNVNTYGSIEQSGTSVVITTDPNTSLDWNLWTIIWDRGNSLRIYRNGLLIDSDSLTDTTTNYNNPYNLLLGAYNNGTDGLSPLAGAYFDGKFAEVVIWKNALNNSIRKLAEKSLGQRTYKLNISE